MSEISVIIPTIGRQSLVSAVDSALNQTHPVLEVLIVNDGIDAIEKSNKIFLDPKVKIINVGPRAGGNVARQTGIEAAHGRIIALLDDDDVWTADRLKLQMNYLNSCSDIAATENWVISSRIVLASGEVHPARVIEDDENVDQYLFTLRRIRRGQGALHTSTLLFPKSLAIRVPFDTELKFHQDIDWLIRTMRIERPEFLQIEAATALTGDTIGSVAKKIPWQGSFEWAVNTLGYDKRILGDFLFTVTCSYALRDGKCEWFKATTQALRISRPSFRALALSSLMILRKILPMTK